jgi:hypothetical protein
LFFVSHSIGKLILKLPVAKKFRWFFQKNLVESFGKTGAGSSRKNQEQQKHLNEYQRIGSGCFQSILEAFDGISPTHFPSKVNPTHQLVLGQAGLIRKYKQKFFCPFSNAEP